jgi:hypothetical protein
MLKKYIQKEMHANSCAKESGEVVQKQKEIISKLVKTKHDLERSYMELKESVKGFDAQVQGMKDKFEVRLTVLLI